MSAIKEKDFEKSSSESGYFSSEISKSSVFSSKEFKHPDEVTKIEEETIEDSGFINSESLQKNSDFIPSYLNQPAVKLQLSESKLEQLFQQDNDGYTSLHKAIICNQQKFIDQVLSITNVISYINVKSDNGTTPLHLAIMLQQYDAIHKLIDSGADLNMRTCSGRNSLHLAVMNGDMKSAEIILSAKSIDNKLLVNLELWNLEGETCFYVASKNRDFQMMELLRDNGANINVREGLAGYTSLHYAVEKRDQDLINFLLNSKVNLDVENYAGLTSYQLCLLNNNESLADFLMKKGAFPFYTREDEDDFDEEMSSDGSCY